MASANSILPVIQGAGAALIQRVRIRSQFAPDFEFNPFAPDTAGPPHPLIALAKPEVTLDTPQGPVVIAPAGTPERALWKPTLLVGGFLMAAGALWTLERLGGFVRRRNPRRNPMTLGKVAMASAAAKQAVPLAIGFGVACFVLRKQADYTALPEASVSRFGMPGPMLVRTADTAAWDAWFDRNANALIRSVPPSAGPAIA